MPTADTIWKELQKGQGYLLNYGYYDQIEDCWRYYNGDQWNGLETAGEKPPTLNFIRPTADHKISTVAQNGMTINYSTMNYGDDYLKCVALCSELNENATLRWERMKMDKEIWIAVQNACVSGDEFTYFFKDEDIELTHIDNTNIYLADEQEEDIQKQKYILITQRLFIDDVKRKAKRNGVKQSDIDAITTDNDTEHQTGDKAKQEVSEKDENGKCTSILRMWKDEKGYVHWCRSVKNCIYEPDSEDSYTDVNGIEQKRNRLKRYPIAHLRWNKEKGSARGISEIYHIIPNQIQLNKMLARACISIKQTAFPHITYLESAIDADQVSKLTTVGSTIPISSQTVQNIKDAIGFMDTTQMQPVVMQIIDILETRTRELKGAGEIATGNVNPEKASGAAIIAQRDSNAKPLNLQVAALKQYIEDIGLIEIDMDIAYNPNGLPIVQDVDIIEEQVQDDGSIAEVIIGKTKEKKIIPIREIEELKLEVKIDVSPTDPYTKYSENTTLENLLAAQLIQLDEFNDISDTNSPTPKQKIKQVLDKRKEIGMASPSEIAALQQKLMIAQTTLQIQQINQQLEVGAGNFVPIEQVQQMEAGYQEQLKQVAKDRFNNKGEQNQNGKNNS